MSSGVHLLYMHTGILDANLMELCAHYSINCNFLLYYYFQTCDQMHGVSVTKLLSNLWPKDVIFVTKVLANQWPYYIKLWQCQIPICDDLNMTSMTVARWWSQQPRHWWCHNLVICQRGIRQPMTNTRLHLWRNRIVTLLQQRHPLSKQTKDCDEKGSSQNALTALTATSVSQADVKLWRKQGIIYDQKHSSYNEFKSMTTQNSSQVGDTSMTKKPISSPMIKCDATIVTKPKSSQKCHKRLIVAILASSMMIMQRHWWQHPY
jgi:hypothetical protein